MVLNFICKKYLLAHSYLFYSVSAVCPVAVQLLTQLMFYFTASFVSGVHGGLYNHCFQLSAFSIILDMPTVGLTPPVVLQHPSTCQSTHCALDDLASASFLPAMNCSPQEILEDENVLAHHLDPSPDVCSC